MGTYIESFCNHNLNTQSLEYLAMDLAHRLRATIEYGNDGYYKIENDQYEEIIDFVKLGEVVIENTTQKFQLVDTYFWVKKFVKENQHSANKSIINIVKDFEFLDEYAPYELRKMNIKYDYDCLLTINSKSVLLEEVMYLDWSHFTYNFVYKINQNDFEYINEWRLKCYHLTKSLGGTFTLHTYYGNVDYIEDYWFKNENNISDFFKKIEVEFEGQFVNIPNYFISKVYENKPEYINSTREPDYFHKINYAKKRKIPLNPFPVKFPEIFYDDFIDLDDKISKQNRFLDSVYSSETLIENIKKNDEFFESIKFIRGKRKLPDLSNYFKIYYGNIAGANHYIDTDLDFDLEINHPVTIAREPNNKHDKKAIALYITINTENVKIGYISRHENYTLSKMLDNGYRLKAFLTNINDNTSIYYRYTIEIYCVKQQ